MNMQVIEDTRRIRNRPPIVLNGRLVNAYALAKQMEIDQSYLRRVLAGERQPTLQYAINLATALSISLGELVEAISSRRSTLSL